MLGISNISLESQYKFSETQEDILLKSQHEQHLARIIDLILLRQHKSPVYTFLKPIKSKNNFYKLQRHAYVL